MAVSSRTPTESTISRRKKLRKSHVHSLLLLVDVILSALAGAFPDSSLCSKRNTPGILNDGQRGPYAVLKKCTEYHQLLHSLFSKLEKGKRRTGREEPSFFHTFLKQQIKKPIYKMKIKLQLIFFFFFK